MSGGEGPGDRPGTATAAPSMLGVQRVSVGARGGSSSRGSPRFQGSARPSSCQGGAYGRDGVPRKQAAPSGEGGLDEESIHGDMFTRLPYLWTRVKRTE